jgi:molecular chaperone GrpE (heat shock protein)
MNEAPDWKVAKWPFLLGNALLLAVAAAVIYQARHPISELEEILAVSAVALGTIAGCLPFILDYRALGKLLEINALTTVKDQLTGLQKYSAQIAAATDQWARVQESTKGHSDKTITMAKDITDRMAQEIREFNEFQTKLNDMEKGALRLEVDKLRRSEGDWLQVVVRMLDHVFALYTAAVRSGQPELADQIGHFQTACRDATRRVGLVPFGLEADEKFDPKKHRVQGVENVAEGTDLSGLLAPGMTYQGRLLRPALVKLAGENEPAPEVSAEPAAVEPTPVAEKTEPLAGPEKTEDPAQDQFTLEPEES